MMRLSLLIIVLLCLFHCKLDQQSSPDPIYASIDALDSNAKKRAWLKALFERDQHMRRGMEGEIISKYGRNSEEVRQFNERFRANDVVNLQQVDYYLQVHGYPSKAKLGELAAAAPWAVIHHEASDSSFEIRRKYLPYIMGAYENGDLDDGAISFYLNRMYTALTGIRHDMGGGYTIEEEINTLLSKMGLR